MSHLILAEAFDLLINCNLTDVVSLYLDTTHTWLPMLSRKRLLKNFQISSADNIDIDSLLLILAMKTIVGDNSAGADNKPRLTANLYQFTKSFITETMNNGYVSIHMIQALVLLCVYEYGHGIYPAAYMTIGQAARLGTMVGLHSEKHAQQLFKGPETWTMCEERRRTWWAIVMLDR